MRITDLIALLDSGHPEYDEIVCFASDLIPSDVRCMAVGMAEDRRVITFVADSAAYGKVVYLLSIHERFGIVVLRRSKSQDPAGAGAPCGCGMADSLTRASSVTFGEPRSLLNQCRGDGTFPPFVAMRRTSDARDDRIQHSQLWRLSAEHGKMRWVSWCGPLSKWIKARLWADVLETKVGKGSPPKESKPKPKPEPEPEVKGVLDYVPTSRRTEWYGPESKSEKPTEAGGYMPERLRAPEAERKARLVRPFPGAEANPHVREGGLCFAGLSTTVEDILRNLADDSQTSDVVRIAASLRVEPYILKRGLRGLADWLRRVDWQHVRLGAVPRERRTCANCAQPCGMPSKDVKDGYDCRRWAPRDGVVRPIEPTLRQETETGRWVSGEEMAEFRRWQNHRDQQGTAQNAPGTRYSAMSRWEFDDLRKDADETIRRYQTEGEGETVVLCKSGFVMQWALKLSRALDVIERVTDERDRCTAARLAQMQKMQEQVEANQKKADEVIEKHEKRCGTCEAGWENLQPGQPRQVCPAFHGSTNTPDGPAWENCRFYKPRAPEKK